MSLIPEQKKLEKNKTDIKPNKADIKINKTEKIIKKENNADKNSVSGFKLF